MFYRSATAWFLGSFGNVFLSVVLGAIAMGFFWFYFPDQFVQLQRSASVTREWIAARAWSNRTESIIRFLLEDRQLLLMAFVVVVRLALNLIALPIRALFARVGIS